MPSRGGKKFVGNHTTTTGIGALVADILDGRPEVTKISLGVLDPRASGGSGRRVKISDLTGGILLTVIGNGGAQEIRVYTRDAQETKLAVARAARDQGITIHFSKKGGS